MGGDTVYAEKELKIYKKNNNNEREEAKGTYYFYYKKILVVDLMWSGVKERGETGEEGMLCGWRTGAWEETRGRDERDTAQWRKPVKAGNP